MNPVTFVFWLADHRKFICRAVCVPHLDVCEHALSEYCDHYFIQIYDWHDFPFGIQHSTAKIMGAACPLNRMHIANVYRMHIPTYFHIPFDVSDVVLILSCNNKPLLPNCIAILILYVVW